MQVHMVMQRMGSCVTIAAEESTSAWVLSVSDWELAKDIPPQDYWRLSSRVDGQMLQYSIQRRSQQVVRVDG